MHASHSPDTWCVIGAGPSGLTALKNLRAAGIAAECLEREDGIGGNWFFGSAASAVFESTRLISSKTLTEYTDFPMPRDWPAYPDRRQCLEYLRSYARHFGLLPHIHTGIPVERIEPAAGRDAGGGWLVQAAGRPPQPYAGVVIASGHNRVPRYPDIPGAFTGTLLHACHYKSPLTPLPLTGKRVLVIGGGNSGIEAAIDLAGIVKHVTVIEFADQLKADAVLVAPSAPVLRERLVLPPEELRAPALRAPELRAPELRAPELPGWHAPPCITAGSQSCGRHSGTAAAVTNPPPISTSRTCADRRMG